MAIAVQMQAKLAICALEKGSPKTNTASENWSVGDKYCRKPIVESRSLRAAAPKNKSGTVVTGPLRAKRPRVPSPGGAPFPVAPR